jgi:two-component system sensor histidine kinase KdpD
MRRGDIYPLDRVERALTTFFRPANLIALRELALREVVQEVDRSLESYLEKEEPDRNLGVRERFAVCISSNPSAQYIIARAARTARRLDAELYVLVNRYRGGRDSGQPTLA